jgi:hypothetical protein
VRNTEKSVLADPDPEPAYYEGALLSYCGKQEVAARMIKSAIDRNYCSAAALKSDPLLAKLRSTPEFQGLASAANDCQKKFQSSVKQPIQ